jgi:hypothetical protein
MILHNSSRLVRAYFYFDEEPVPVDADVIICYQSPVRRVGFRCTSFHTRVIDLHRPPAHILQDIERDVRRQVRNAELKDGLLYSCCSSGDPQLLREFFELQDQFTAKKNLPSVDRGEVSQMAKAGVLDITFVRDSTGLPLVWATCYRGFHRLRALQGGSFHRDFSTSADKQLYSRANRMLWYKNILRAQELGLDEFDFGGWHMGTEDREKLATNQFKKQFGGTVIEEYHCLRGATLKGKVALELARTKKYYFDWREKRLLQNSRAVVPTSHEEEEVPA